MGKKENDFWESFDKQLLEAQAEEEDFELRKKEKNIVKEQDHIAKDQDRNYTEQNFKRDNLAQRKYFNFETIAEQVRNAKTSIDTKAERLRNANRKTTFKDTRKRRFPYAEEKFVDIIALPVVDKLLQNDKPKTSNKGLPLNPKKTEYNQFRTTKKRTQQKAAKYLTDTITESVNESKLSIFDKLNDNVASQKAVEKITDTMDKNVKKAVFEQLNKNVARKKDVEKMAAEELDVNNVNNMIGKLKENVANKTKKQKAATQITDTMTKS